MGYLLVRSNVNFTFLPTVKMYSGNTEEHKSGPSLYHCYDAVILGT